MSLLENDILVDIFFQQVGRVVYVPTLREVLVV